MSSARRPKLSWLQIKLAVHEQGMTLTELAIRNGFHPSLIRKLKTATHYRAQQALADFIGRRPEDLWPSRYPQGKPSILNTKKWPSLESQKSNGASGMREAA